MASFRDICLTPAEFANIAKIDRSIVSDLEELGALKTVKRRVGRVDRKMIALEDMQDYFRVLRANPELVSAVAAATAKARQETVAVATDHGDSGEQVSATAEQALASDAATANPVAAATTPEEQSPSLDEVSRLARLPQYKIQMFYNVKGGTGKSTLAAQYAMRAAMLGLRVLALDLDGQGHLSVNLDILDAHERPTIYDVLINDLPIKDAIMSVAPGLDLIPANLGLCTIEIPLNQKARREYRLKEAIAKVAANYDVIIADTNPAASILNSSMLVATDLVNIICATNPLSFHGMSLVMATIEEMEKEFSRECAVRVIPNMYDNREVISQEVLGELRSQFGDVCAKAVINRSADLNEATKRRTTVWDVNSKGIGATDINALTEELLF